MDANVGFESICDTGRIESQLAHYKQNDVRGGRHSELP